MTLLRTLTFAAIILAILLILGSLATAPGFTAVLRIIGYGSYLPFSLTAAAAITNQRSIIIATALIVLLSVIPCNTREFATAVAPLGIGMLAGAALQRAMRDAAENLS